MSTPTTTPNQDTLQVNAFALKALLLDTIFQIKHGAHIHRNQIMSKRAVCLFVGISPRTPAKKFLSVLYLIYKNNEQEAEFLTTIRKFGINLAVWQICPLIIRWGGFNNFNKFLTFFLGYDNLPVLSCKTVSQKLAKLTANLRPDFNKILTHKIWYYN